MYGTEYQIGTFTVIKLTSNEIQFGKIEQIVSIDSEVFFYVQIFEEITFDNHVHAYIVYCKGMNILVKFNDLPKISPGLYVKRQNDEFIAFRYKL